MRWPSENLNFPVIAGCGSLDNVRFPWAVALMKQLNRGVVPSKFEVAQTLELITGGREVRESPLIARVCGRYGTSSVAVHVVCMMHRRKRSRGSSSVARC